MCDIVHEDLTGLDVPFVQGQRAYSVPISGIEVSLKTRFAQPSFDPGIRHRIQYVKKTMPRRHGRDQRSTRGLQLTLYGRTHRVANII